MSFFFEGNAYLDQSFITNSTVTNNIITVSSITTSSIDMLSVIGNYQNITSVKDPLNRQDAATKNYVDLLGITINDYTLIATSGTLITGVNHGSFVITVTNLVAGGPSAVFNITKNQISNCGAVQRTVGAPGNDRNCTLDITWSSGSGVSLFKTNSNYDGTYRVKIM
jgi:hypothetical protein